jgi:Fe-S-cluster containining protein
MHKLLQQYKTLLESVDSWFHQTQRQFPQAIVCRSGCCGCCRGFFDITLLDAALVSLGFHQLTLDQKNIIHGKALDRLIDLQTRWPGFTAPYMLNGMPESAWTEMPDDDDTPCPFLGDNGLCLIYAFRPMTCRLHGIPNIDFSGESFSDDYCSLNFHGMNPLSLSRIRSGFRQTFLRELDLFQAYTKELTGRSISELDTMLPLVPLIEFDQIDWHDMKLYTLVRITGPTE